MIPSISKSGLDLIQKSPIDYWWQRLSPDAVGFVADDKYIFEEAFRCAVFTPEIFQKKYARFPKIDRSTSIGKMEFASLMKSITENNQIPIPSAQYDSIIQDHTDGAFPNCMTVAIKQHPTLKLLFSGEVGKPSKFTDVSSQVEITFEPHFIHNGGLVVHLQSTSDASPSYFKKECERLRLHKKAALQVDGMDYNPFGEISGEDWGFTFVFVEREPPFKIGIYELDINSMQHGRREYIENCELYRWCLNNNRWPGLSPKVVNVGLSEWVFNQ